MSTKQITYTALICLLLIFSTQAYLVYDYFQTTRAGLIRESDTIIEETFKAELNIRHKKFKSITGEDTITIDSPAKKEETLKFDYKRVNDKSRTVLEILDLALNTVICKYVPENIHNLDSITGTIIHSRNIHSEFCINIIDLRTGKVLEHSDKKFIASVLTVPSKLLQVDLDKKKALQLVLINPFGLIMKRMGLMLLSSFIFSIICFLAFRFLLRVLAQQKKLVAFKDEFLGNIAHELKRPVASLSFNLDCLTLPAFIDNRQQHDLLVSKSINATSELNSTINMIVALSKVEEGLLVLNKHPINLKKLIDDLKNKFISYPVKKVEIQTVYELDEFSILGDAQLLSQCFANLIDNAIKYSNNEVLIVISVQKTGHWIVVSIKDNGFGIPEEKLPVIFDKYSRVHSENTKINGFGIGLNYVKAIVEKHKGTVEATSISGIGSEFSVLLPL